MDKFFKDLIEREKLNTSDHIQKECVWFCFSSLIQASLDEVKESWNIHYIHKSIHDTVCGRPDAIHSFPKAHGGISRLILCVLEDELAYANEHLIERENESEYQDHLKYVMDTLNLQEPGDWREALQLYENLTAIAVDGM